MFHKSGSLVDKYLTSNMKDICHSWIAAFTVLCLIRNIHCFLQNNDWEKVVNAARCRVKCLSSLQVSVTVCVT